MSVRIDEPLPLDSTEAEAVLHVRRLLRQEIRTTEGEERAQVLALLFGRPETDARRLRRAARSERPIASAAAVVADAHGVARLGHDAAHVEQCRQWLLSQKEAEEAYRDILAYDLGTLLALSRARMLARAGGQEGRPPVPVLIWGATGTGKELLARALHQMSERAGQLVPVHVAGLSQDHITDEIFGHVKGSYTGAASARAGRIEQAKGGTIHLDEVGDLPPEAQVRLLRVLQDGEYSRLGEDKVRKADVRVIAATWRDLRTEIEEKRFRQDLLHRICAGEVFLPPLAERKTDFGRLLQAMLERLGATRPVTRAASDALTLYDWPGNLRELENALRVAVDSAGTSPVRLEDLPVPLQRHYLAQPLELRAPGILCDDPDDLELSLDIVTMRVQSLESAIAEDTPTQALPPVTTSFLGAMAGLPDVSGGHDALMKEFQGMIEVGQRGARALQISARLATISEASGLPEVVQMVVRAAGDRHKAAGEQSLESVRVAAARFDFRRSVWGRLYADIHELPGFEGKTALEVWSVVSVAVKLAHALAPDLLDRLRERIGAGGLAALVEGVRGPSAEECRPGGELQEEPQGHPNTWSRAQWERLLVSHPTRKSLEIATGMDGKTIKRHLHRHGIQAPWARAQPRP